MWHSLTLFLLTAVTAMSTPDAEAWSALGGYVFPVGSQAQVLNFSATRVGDRFVYDTGSVPVTPELVLPYLRGATEALLRPDSGGPAWRRLTADLSAKAKEYAPELATAIQDRPLTTGDAPSIRPQNPVPYSRADIVRVTRFRNAWSAKDDTLLEAASAFEDEDVETRARLLIRFARASDALETRDADLALGFASQLPAGVCRALVYYGAAKLRLAEGDKQSSYELFLLAAADTKDADSVTRGRLLMSVAREMSVTEQDLAAILFTDAIRGLNAVPNPGENLKRPYSAPLTNDGFPVSIALSVPGLPVLNWPEVVLALVGDLGPDRVEVIVSELHDEELLGQALLALAELHLRGLPSTGGSGLQPNHAH